jgi:hypothetical protein
MKAATTPIAALSLIACTTASQTSDAPADRCPTTDCFNQQQVRNFEVLDGTTLVLYVGNQDCPFLVEFIGSSCDLTFLGSGTLVFRPDTLREEFESDIRFMRICARDIGVGVAEDPFIDSDAGDLPGTTLACHIRNVASLTDDELLELYVERNLTPPPPPLGTGQVTVPDEEPPAEPADAREATEEGSAPASP